MGTDERLRGSSETRSAAKTEERRPDEEDREPGNVMIRAGYLRGLAARLTGDDRLFALRASRSLLAYADHLREQQS